LDQLFSSGQPGLPDMGIFQSNYSLSYSSNFFKGLMPQRDSHRFNLKESIGSFDDSTMTGHEESGIHEEGALQKRKRGRPKKVILEGKNSKKKIVSEEPDLKEDNLIFMNENAHVFESDSDEQKIDLQLEELDLPIEIVFNHHNGMNKSNDAEERTRSYRLDIGKLIRAIESEQAKNKIKKFVCRFCGKAFDKPSSLGGHTAKTHNGLSLKYKNRLTAAKNRKTERNRIQFLKQSINDGMEDEPEA
jgi:hypothetical protein